MYHIWIFILQLLNFKFFKFHRNSNRALSHNHSSEDISIKKKFRGDNKMEVGKFSRVNGAWLKENVGNQVALVGKVVESDADTVKITASVRSFLFVFGCRINVCELHDRILST